MSTDLATMPPTQVGYQPPAPLDANTLEKLVINGDLSTLTQPQRLAYYKFRAEAIGIDPGCRPFDYLTLQGKTVLYATKSCTDQLTNNRRISLSIVRTDYLEPVGIYQVTCRATFPDGRSVEDVGAVALGILKGEAAANAYMKAVTKAKRRAVLSACGLGMLDETEAEAELSETAAGQIGGAKGYSKTNPHPRNTGYGSGEFLHPDKDAEYEKWSKGYLAKINQRWDDHWEQVQNRGIGLPSDMPTELLNFFQFSNHLMRWVRETDWLDPAQIRTEDKSGFAVKYLSLVYHGSAEGRAALKAEAAAYAQKKFAEKCDALYRKHPELMPEGYAEQQEEARREVEADDTIDVEAEDIPPAEDYSEADPDGDFPGQDPGYLEGKGEAYDGPELDAAPAKKPARSRA